MGTTGTVLMCVVLCSVIQPDFTNGESNFNRNSTSRSLSYELGRGIHRVQMLFPLLLGISGRLATLVPTALMGLFGIFLFVAFSKKAFIISLIALFLTYLDRFKKSEEKVVYIHRIHAHPPVHPHVHHDHDEDFQQEEEHIHYHWPYKKHHNNEFYQRNAIPYRNWKRPQRRPYPPHVPPHQSQPYHFYHRPEPLRRETFDVRPYHQQINKTEEADFQELETEESVEMENDIVKNSPNLD